MQHRYHTSFDGKVSSKRLNAYAIIPCAYAYTVSQPRVSQCLDFGTLVQHMPYISSFFHFAAPAVPPHSDISY